MRLLLIPLFLIALLGLASCGSEEEIQTVTDMPWQIQADQAEYTQVIGLRVGEDTLGQVVEKLKKFPSLGIFTGNDVKVLEAWFSRVRLGVLDAGLVAEVDVENVDVSSYARLNERGKPMPSGFRKFTLSNTGIESAGKLRVWKLTYMPKTNYEEAQLLRFFGEPNSKETVSEQVENWLYPEKGLLIVYDREGREMFHYTARKDYARLRVSLKELAVEQ